MSTTHSILVNYITHRPKKIAESTNVLIKSICSYIAQKVHSIEKENKTIITKLKDNHDAANVDDRQIEDLKNSPVMG